MKCKSICLMFVSILLLNYSCFKNNIKSEPVKIKFKLDWKNGVQFAGFYVAQYKGYYKNENLIVEFTNAKTAQELPDIPFEVEKGEFTLAAGSAALTLAQSKGAKVTAVSSIYQYGPHVLFAKKTKGINSLKDIKGHTIVDKGGSWKDMVEKLLLANGLKTDDVKYIQGGFDMTPFYNDEVDIWTGYIIDEVPRARLKGFELITFPLYEYNVINIGGTIYGSTDYIKQNHDTVIKFLRATIKGWEYAVAEPENTADIILKMFPEIQDKKDFLLMSLSASIPLVKVSGKQIGNIDSNEYNGLIKNLYKLENKNFSTDIFIREIYNIK